LIHFLSANREQVTQFHVFLLGEAGLGGIKMVNRQLFNGITQRFTGLRDPVCPGLSDASTHTLANSSKIACSSSLACSSSGQRPSQFHLWEALPRKSRSSRIG
jgi:hypothetical protein